MKKMTPRGWETKRLANFDARIVEEVTRHHGGQDRLEVAIEAKLQDGRQLARVRVTPGQLRHMNFVIEKWGTAAIIEPGIAAKDHLLAAIQTLSPNPRQRTIYAHTGWITDSGKSLFLMPSGALGQDGYEVELAEDLGRYSLPRNIEDAKDAMKTGLRLLDLAPAVVTVPLFAGVFAAPLASILEVDFSLWLVGPTGSYKSTLAALFLSLFGDFGASHLPANWSSTANSLELRASALRDLPLVIDDYCPTRMDARELEAKSGRLLRAQGNRQGRGRLNADLTELPACAPSGVIIVTAEQRPTAQSILARTLTLEVDKRDVNLTALTDAQASAGRLKHATAGYLQSLALQMPGLTASLKQSLLETRRKMMAPGEHSRMAGIRAQLWTSFDGVLTYAQKIGARPPRDIEELRKVGEQALEKVTQQHAKLIGSNAPLPRFFRVLAALLTARRVFLADVDCGTRERMIGWHDREYLYLMPDAAYAAVVGFCREQSDPYPLSLADLTKQLSRDGLSEADQDRHTATKWIDGKSRRVLKLRREKVTELIEETFPFE
ncbi:MAG TPA: DUF927 domain-containing protein [Terriglobia bacterium]|jgi:hypothetical protein|nr:DUF927 domain-containing protein [Terriglobia bacterium]